MARIAQRKLKSDIAKPSDNDGRLKSAAILKVGNDNKIDFNNVGLGSFELNPSSYEENKTTGWVSQQTPGQSDPVHQWVSGGARTVTFEALVTKDHIHAGQNDTSPIDDLADAALNVVGDIASTFAGVSLPPVSSLFSPEDAAASGRTLDISDKLGYYRSLAYPQYSDDHKSLQSSPPLVALMIGRTFSNFTASEQTITGADVRGSHMPLWFIDNLNIRITKQLPNLDPMEARVTFTLVEYTIVPISSQNMLSYESPPTQLGDFDILSGLGGLV